MDNYLTPPPSPEPVLKQSIQQPRGRVGWPWPHGYENGFDCLDALERTDPDEAVMYVSAAYIELEATGTWVQYSTFNLSKHYAPYHYQDSPRFISRRWTHSDTGKPQPSWVGLEADWAVVRLDLAVRQVEHFASKSYNLVHADEMITWARRVKTCAQAVYHRGQQSRLMWPSVGAENLEFTPAEFEFERRRREERRDDRIWDEMRREAERDDQ